LVSALGQVPDVRRCVTMDLKAAGNRLYLVGVTKSELGGSHYNLVTGQEGGEPPPVDLQLAPRLFAAMHAAITQGLVRSCHDLSEGGLAVAAAEMAFAGGVGADITGGPAAAEGDDAWLFSESTTRWFVEVDPDSSAAFETCFAGLPVAAVGTTVAEPRLRIGGAGGEWVVWAPLADLKAEWQSLKG
jgi:phosphoribosylformylglycinamidine synthase